MKRAVTDGLAGLSGAVVDGDDEDQEAVVSKHDPTSLAPLARFAVSCADRAVTNP